MRNSWSGQTFDHLDGRLPFVGDIRNAALQRGRPISNLMGIGPQMGPIFELAVFGQKFVFVQGAELATELCDDSRFHKALPPAVSALRQFVGDALFTAEHGEPAWQTAHDILMPAFAKESMRGYHDTMLEVVREMFALWDGRSESFEVVPDMTRLTLETISRCAFSRDFGSFTRETAHPFVAAMIAALTTGLRKGMIATLPGHQLLERRIDRDNAAHLAYIDELVDSLIRERRASGDQRGDLLDLMLDTAHPVTGERLSSTNIRYQILTFLVAGHETTSGALSFALYHLSRDPDALAKAYAETDEILGDDPDAEPTFEQVPKFRHLRRVLDEALRLWPTAPAFARSPHQPTVIGGRYRMTPDDWAIIVLPLMHRDTAAWGPDADTFSPDRFLPHRSGGSRGLYKPFGTGERACIGRQFALHEATLVLARVLHRYAIVGDPGYQLALDERLTIVPRGFTLQLRQRAGDRMAHPVG